MTRPKKRSLMRHVKLLSSLAALGTLAYAQNAKLSSDLQAVDATSQVKVIVQYNHPPTAADHQRTLGAHGVMGSHLGVVSGGSDLLPASDLANVANDGSVTHISLDHPIQAHLDYTTAATNATIAR